MKVDTPFLKFELTSNEGREFSAWVHPGLLVGIVLLLLILTCVLL